MMTTTTENPGGSTVETCADGAKPPKRDANKIRRTTKGEVVQRVTEVFDLLLDGLRPCEVIRYVAEKWGVRSRQAENYLAKAYKQFEEAGRTKQERELGRAFTRLNRLYSIAISARDYKQALSVQKELNELLGLMVQKIKHSGEVKTISDLIIRTKEYARSRNSTNSGDGENPEDMEG